MNKIYIFILHLFIYIAVFGQENKIDIKDLKNTLLIEALGNGLFGSINYERQITSEPGLSLRIGIGFYTENDFYLTLPLSIQYLIDLKKSNFIEAGIGYTWAYARADNIFNGDNPNTDNLKNLFLSVGYRKHFGKDWMWKVNFTPLITNNNDVTLPWIGLSIGKRF